MFCPKSFKAYNHGCGFSLVCSCKQSHPIKLLQILPDSILELYGYCIGITQIDKLPISLQKFCCDYNRISLIENLPKSLQTFNCSNNRITRIEHLPDSLQHFSFIGNPIQYVDNLLFTDYNLIFKRFRVKEYTKIKKCTIIINNWYKTHKEAALVITRGCHNWIWKPYCNDNTIGIRPRLDMQGLGLLNSNYRKN
jgi:hypothetical protein